MFWCEIKAYRSAFAHFCNASANFRRNLSSNQACALVIYFHKAAVLRVVWRVTVQPSFACDTLPSSINGCSSEMAGHFLFHQAQQRSVNLWQFLKVGFKRNIKPFTWASQYLRRNAPRKRKDRQGNLRKWKLHYVGDLALPHSGFMLINTLGMRWRGLYAIR